MTMTRKDNDVFLFLYLRVGLLLFSMTRMRARLLRMRARFRLLRMGARFGFRFALLCAALLASALRMRAGLRARLPARTSSALKHINIASSCHFDFLGRRGWRDGFFIIAATIWATTTANNNFARFNHFCEFFATCERLCFMSLITETRNANSSALCGIIICLKSEWTFFLASDTVNCFELAGCLLHF